MQQKLHTKSKFFHFYPAKKIKIPLWTQSVLPLSYIAVVKIVSSSVGRNFCNTLYKTDGQVVTERVDLFTPESERKKEEITGKTKETIDFFPRVLH